MKTILVIGQDAPADAPLTTLLRAKGYQVIGASNGIEMQTILEMGAAVDIVIACLPITAGEDHLEALRKRNPRMPVLYVASPSGAEHEKPEQAEALAAPLRSCRRRGPGEKILLQDISRKIRIALHASSAPQQSWGRQHKSAYSR